MTATTRKVLIGVLIVGSLLCGIGAACMVGSIIHAGSQMVAKGPDAAVLPSSTGWIATALMLLGTWLGGSWAKWLATAAKAVPVVKQIINNQSINEQLRRMGKQPPLEQMPNQTTPEQGSSHEALLSALLTTLEITSGQHVHSEGKHSLGGGTIAWSIDFTPGQSQPATV